MDKTAVAIGYDRKTRQCTIMEYYGPNAVNRAWASIEEIKKQNGDDESKCIYGVVCTNEAREEYGERIMDALGIESNQAQ